MGRIAEALKRAEQERARHLENEMPGAPGAMPAPAPEVQAPVAEDPAGPSGFEGPDAVQTPPAIESVTSAPQPVDAFVSHAAPLAPDCVHASVVTLHNPACPVAERFRAVRTRLLTSNPNGSARLHAITSSAPREGRTVTAANLAFSLAELRHLRIALVDLDFRQRGMERLLGAAGRPGIAEVIRGDHTFADVCIPLVRPNLHFIPAGDAAGASVSELLSCQRAINLFRQISERFHYALIDTPPISTVADVGVIAPLCHSTIFLIRMNVTPEPLARRCLRILQANGVPVVGSILAGGCEENHDDPNSQDYYQAVGGEA